MNSLLIIMDSEVQKIPQKREDHLILTNIGVKKFIVKNTQTNKPLMFEC